MSIYDNPNPSIPGGVGGATIDNVNVYPVCEVELRHLNVNYDGTASFQVWIKYDERWKLWHGETAPSDIAFFSMSFKDITIIKVHDDMQYHSQYIYPGSTAHEAWSVLDHGYFERRTVIKTNPNSEMDVSSSYFFSTASDTWERLCTVYFHADTADNSVTAANLENVVINSVHAQRLVHSDFNEVYGSSNIYPNYDANVHEQFDQDTYPIPTNDYVDYANASDLKSDVTTPQGNTGRRIESITFSAGHTVSKVKAYVQWVDEDAWDDYEADEDPVWSNAQEFEINANGDHHNAEVTTIKDNYWKWEGTLGQMVFHRNGGYRVSVLSYNPQTGDWRRTTATHFGISNGDDSYDNEAPVITLLNGTNQTITQGESWSESIHGGYTVTDNLDDSSALHSAVQVGGIVDVNTLGTHTLVYNVQDAAGNIAATKTRYVTVAAPPNEAPVLTLNGDATIYLNVGDELVDPGATATDVEDNDSTLTSNISYTDIPSVFSTDNPGTLQRTYTVQDEDGAWATPVTRNFVVQAVDQAPTLTLATGTEIVYVPINTDWTTSDATAETTYGGFTATDAEDSVLNVTLSVPENWNSGADAGEYTFTYSVTDTAGNTATATRTVIVLDPPTISAPHELMPGVYTHNSWWSTNSAWTAWGVYANGNHHSGTTYTGNTRVRADGTLDYQHYGDLQKELSETGPSRLANGMIREGQYIYDLTVTDLAGQSATATTVLIVDPATDYRISVSGEEHEGDFRFSVQLGADVDHGHYSLTDRSDSANYTSGMFAKPAEATSFDVWFHVIVQSDSLDPQHGTFDYVVTGVNADHEEVTDQKTGTIIIEQADTAPVITMTGKHTYEDPLMWEMGDAWVEPGVSATDAEDGTISVTTDTSGLDISQPGTYFVNYSATDSDNNTVTAQRTVVVCDNAAPTLTLNGDASVTVTQSNDDYADPGATAMDGGGDISGQIVTTGSVDRTTPGSYTIEYNVSDASGNAAPPVFRTVTVEAVSPTITLNGDMMVHVEVYGGVWTDPGATAVDYDGTPLSNIQVDDPVVQGQAGEYTVTYTVTGAFGNTDTKTRMVHIDVHRCPVVVDGSVPEGTPDLSGKAIAFQGQVNYNGTQIDVSSYSSAQWNSMAENVGLGSSFVHNSALNVNHRGNDMLQTQYWENFPINNVDSMNISEYASSRQFALGVGRNLDGSTPVIQETVIKFISYLSERAMPIQSTLATFEKLAGPSMVYPFDWHCALDSKFAAQDVVLMASPKIGIVDLQQDTLYPAEFVRFRLNELKMRNLIDNKTYHRKAFGIDGAGYIKQTGEKMAMNELHDLNFERWTLFNDKVKTGQNLVRDNVPLVRTKYQNRFVPRLPSRIWDVVHNTPSTNDPTKRMVRRAPVQPTVPSDTETKTFDKILELSVKGIFVALENYITDEHMTPEFLGGLWQREAATRNRYPVKIKIEVVASTGGVNIDSYFG